LTGWFICSLFIVQCANKFLFPVQRITGGIGATAIFFLLALIAVQGGTDNPVFVPSGQMRQYVSRNLFGLFYYHLGYLCAEAKAADRMLSLNGVALFTAIQYWLSTRLGSRVNFARVWNIYHSFVATFAAPISAIYVILYLSRLLAKHAVEYNLLEFVGNSSLHILIWHRSIFFAINLCFITYHNDSLKLLQHNFWYNYDIKTTWPLYVGLGGRYTDVYPRAGNSLAAAIQSRPASSRSAVKDYRTQCIDTFCESSKRASPNRRPPLGSALFASATAWWHSRKSFSSSTSAT
jgi:hypothetical protein